MDLVEQWRKIKKDKGYDAAVAFIWPFVYREPQRLATLDDLLVYIDDEFSFRRAISERILKRCFGLSIDENHLKSKIDTYKTSIELFCSYIGENASRELQEYPLIYGNKGSHSYCVVLVTTNTGTYTITYVSYEGGLVGEIIIDVFPLPIIVKL